MVTRTAPQAPIASVPRLCPGGTVVCIGSGPSLTEDDVQYCQGQATVIAVNDSVRFASWADCCYASDAAWWAHHRGLPMFAGLKYSLEPAAARYGVTVLRRTGTDGIESAPTGLKTGYNSGAASINLAVHFGATRVLLLGYDCGPDRKGREHFFGAHPRPLRNGSPYELFSQMFSKMVPALKAAGVTVINCSRETRLTAFARMPLREALALATCEVCA